MDTSNDGKLNEIQRSFLLRKKVNEWEKIQGKTIDDLVNLVENISTNGRKLQRNDYHVYVCDEFATATNGNIFKSTWSKIYEYKYDNQGIPQIIKTHILCDSQDSLLSWLRV